MSPRRAARVFSLTVSLTGILGVQIAFGQAGGGQTTTPPAGTGGGTSLPGTGTTPGRGTPNIPTTPQPQQQQQQPQMRQPIFVSGRVVIDDGSPLPEPVTLERICGGNARSEGYTDSKGFFSFELGGRNNTVMRDASEGPDLGDSGFGGGRFGGSNPSMANSMPSIGGGLNDNRFMNCDLRARLAGYRSQQVSLANRRALDNPDVGIILLHRLTGDEGGTTISAAMLAAPKDARKAYEKGMDGLKKNKPADAIKSFQKALEIHPTLAPALYEMGRLQAKQNQPEEARKLFDAAMKGDPKFVPPYLEVAAIEAQAKNWQQVADLTGEVVKLNSFDYPQAYFYNAVANFNLHNMEQAEKSARQATRLDTRHMMPKASHLLGIILQQRQDYTGAAENLRDYLKFAPTAPDIDAVRGQLDMIEKASAQAKQQ